MPSASGLSGREDNSVIKVGGGGRTTAFHNFQNLLLHRILAEHVLHSSWNDAVKLSGREPTGCYRHKRGTDLRITRIHERGFKTIRDLSDATGVPHWTIRRLEDKRLPQCERVEGIKVVSPERFDKLAALVRDLVN